MSHLVFSALKNQAAIETNPVEKGDEVIGWQAKFYDTSLSIHKNDLVTTIEKAKIDYPNITKLPFLLKSRVGTKQREKSTRIDGC